MLGRLLAGGEAGVDPGEGWALACSQRSPTEVGEWVTLRQELSRDFRVAGYQLIQGECRRLGQRGDSGVKRRGEMWGVFQN